MIGAVQPWTCPHCQATWHSGRQYCVDCGYGMGAQGQAETLAALGTMPRATAEEIEYEFLKREKADGRWVRPRPGDVPPEPEEAHATLRRSLEAESALQAEVAVLRERVAQLEARLDEQRRVFVTGVQQMLAPLRQYFEARSLQVPFEALVSQAVEELDVLTRTAAHLREEAKTLRRPVEVRRVAPEMRQLQELSSALAHLAQRVLDLEASSSSAAPDQGQGPQSYDTFVMSDRAAAEIERAILSVQDRGQGYAP